MKTKLTEISAILLILSIFFGMIPITVTAGEDYKFTEGYYGYDIIDSTAIIQEYTGKEENVIIPSELGGCPVVAIGEGVFSYKYSFKSITIPDSVVIISDYSFNNCHSLIEINADFNNTAYLSIDGVLFNKDKTELIFYPRYKAGENFNIPEGVIKIKDCAFHYSAMLKTITIPESVSTIDDYAFKYCYGFVEINVNLNNSIYSSIDGVLFNKDKTELIFYPRARNEKNYILPEGVMSIGHEAFYYCVNLSNITISDSVTSINDYAFRDAHSLTSINVNHNNSVYSSIDGVLFNKDKTKLILYPLSKKDEGYTIPNGVVSIGDLAFFGCHILKSVIITDGVTNIGKYAFGCCENLKNVTISEGVISIDDGAFTQCEKIENIIIPNGTANIGNMVFAQCVNLKSIILPEGVISIGDEAFYYCSNLESITIPYGTMSIGDSAFKSCPSLKSITLPDTLISIGDYAFSYCTSLESIIIPSGVTIINDGAFSKCTSLKSIVIQGSIVSINDDAFYCCSRLESITIPDSVVNIGDKAFYDCIILVVYCYDESYANSYVVAEKIKFILISLESKIDETTGIKITPDNAIEKAIVLNVEEVTEGGDFKFASELFAEDVFTLFNIELMKNNESVQIDGEVKVAIPVQEWHNKEKYKVCRIEDGEEVDMGAILQNGYFVFKTEQLGLFAIVTEPNVALTIYGDVNGDGEISIQDAIMIFRHLAGKETITDGFDLADVNGDGDISIQDAIMIFRYLAGKIELEDLQAMHGFDN